MPALPQETRELSPAKTNWCNHSGSRLGKAVSCLSLILAASASWESIRSHRLRLCWLATAPWEFHSALLWSGAECSLSLTLRHCSEWTRKQVGLRLLQHLA